MAFAYKVLHGGGDIGKDKKTGDYYVGKQVEYKGDGAGATFL
ncbi:hypothetical protein [Chitinophaga oryziterrae]|nr:hypothetical protein [Chitinophaga oryziterrae]